jgi:hypothetical protein
MATSHISDVEAMRDFGSLLDRVKAGEEIVIDAGTTPVVMRRIDVGASLGLEKDPSITATLARMEESAKRLGYKPKMDADFVADMEEIIAKRKPADRSAWD